MEHVLHIPRGHARLEDPVARELPVEANRDLVLVVGLDGGGQGVTGLDAALEDVVELRLGIPAVLRVGVLAVGAGRELREDDTEADVVVVAAGGCPHEHPAVGVEVVDRRQARRHLLVVHDFLAEVVLDVLGVLAQAETDGEVVTDRDAVLDIGSTNVAGEGGVARDGAVEDPLVDRARVAAGQRTAVAAAAILGADTRDRRKGDVLDVDAALELVLASEEGQRGIRLIARKVVPTRAEAIHGSVVAPTVGEIPVAEVVAVGCVGRRAGKDLRGRGTNTGCLELAVGGLGFEKRRVGQGEAPGQGLDSVVPTVPGDRVDVAGRPGWIEAA